MTASAAEAPPLERGVFTLSLDFELIWGTTDLYGVDGFRRACEIERAVVVDRLLALLAEFDISATWCILGHLFLDRCDGVHEEIVRPRHAWLKDDWFHHDPGGTEETAPLFLARSLVEKVRACRTPQEIGSHSFSHVIFDDPGCSRETAESELKASIVAAESLGLRLRSFAFPRNRVGYPELLRAYGFSVYRGAGPNWYESGDAGWRGRLAHLWDVVTMAEPLVVRPRFETSGICNLPGSMIYFPRHGIRRLIPMAFRVRRARRGLEAAARECGVFHLWFHPTNLADDMDAMFEGLRDVFSHVSELRRAGRLVVAPMSAFGRESS